MRDNALTTGDVAEILGVTTMTVIRYVDKGELPCRVLPSGHRRFNLIDVEKLRDRVPPDREEATG